MIYCWIPITGRKCCVPNSKSCYKSRVKDTKTNFHKYWKEWEKKIQRGRKWSMTTEYFTCSKNFKVSDFVYHIDDTNNCRKRRLQKEKLKYRYVKEGAPTTKFWNYPSHLSKKKPAERPSLSFSDAREKISAQILESKRLNDSKWYIQLFKWITFYRAYLFRLQNWSIKNGIYDTFSSQPFLKYSLVILMI